MDSNNYRPDLDRLYQVLDYVTTHRGDGDGVYAMLQRELRIEESRLSDRLSNPYLNNLYQTEGKGWNDYKNARSNKFVMRNKFISSFEDDVREAIAMAIY